MVRFELLLACLSFDPSMMIRRDVVKKFFDTTIATVGTATFLPTLVANVQVEEVEESNEKTKIISDQEIKDIVEKDIVERQFLVTGNLTPRIYRSTALFTDEIDTYAMDQWMTGTQKLFVGEQSDVRLVGDVVVTPTQVEFRFDEHLMFRIPFRPTVYLTGKVILRRDDEGYITSYQEFWDQDVFTVLKSAKF